MPYIYEDVDKLQNTNKVGSKHCVALIQHYTDAPNTGDWGEGQEVMSSSGLAKGTAIATFVAGRYPNHGSGNHAAFLLSVEKNGIWVMDQWKDDASKPKVSKRFIRSKGKDKKGKFIDPSNNADAYSVIN